MSRLEPVDDMMIFAALKPGDMIIGDGLNKLSNYVLVLESNNVGLFVMRGCFSVCEFYNSTWFDDGNHTNIKNQGWSHIIRSS